MRTLNPWEVPTHGKPPPLRVRYGRDADGRRYVLNASAWMLLIAKADGSRVPLPRTAAWLDDGDEVLQPASHTEAVDAATLRAAQVTGLVEYDRERYARAKQAEASEGEFADEPTVADRWWWHRRDLPYERVLWLEPGPYGTALLRVGLNDGINIEGNWWFTDHDAAWRAALGWNGEGDPPDGWTRHLETARRRLDGTAATEYWNAAEAPRSKG